MPPEHQLENLKAVTSMSPVIVKKRESGPKGAESNSTEYIQDFEVGYLSRDNIHYWYLIILRHIFELKLKYKFPPTGMK